MYLKSEIQEEEWTVEQAITAVCSLLKLLTEGKHWQPEGETYPIAMGEDGSVGWLYTSNRVVGGFTVEELVKMVRKHKPIFIPSVK
jgi:hypothetical protein